MTNLLKSRSCLECGDELLKRESDLCERCVDAEIQEEAQAQMAIKNLPRDLAEANIKRIVERA
jgi:hypothetical protein